MDVVIVAKMVREALLERGVKTVYQGECSFYTYSHTIRIGHDITQVYYTNRAGEIKPGWDPANPKENGVIDLHDPNSFDALARIVDKRAWGKAQRKRTRKARKKR